MPEQNQGEQLDRFVEAVIASPRAPLPNTDAELASLARVAADLRGLPREDFKERLKADLIRRASSMASGTAVAPEKSAMAAQTEAIKESVSVPSSETTAVTPYLHFRNAAAALEFYRKAFGAVETLRLNGPGPKIGHAQILIGKAMVMLADEFPDYGALSPETVGGSPITLHLYVPDVDAFVSRAVGAGATIVRPVRDEFYGSRTGQIADPFGYTWTVATRKEEVSAEEMQRRIDAMVTGQTDKPATKPAVNPIPRGFRTLQPYLVAADGPALLDFVRDVFGAEETCRLIGRTGGVHGEVRIGDTMLMMGGGIPGRSFEGKFKQGALHVYVPDTDAVYEKALVAGATSIGKPQDHEYGERGAGVKDPAGNYWYIATHKGENYIPQGLHSVNVYMHPLRAEPVIRFLKQAFGAEEIAKYASPDGVVHHAQVRIVDSVLEMGEAHGPYHPMESMFYLYVPDVDAVYHRAVAAGAKTLQELTDQPYGDRNAAVTDAFGNTWYIGTHVRDV
jgi:PhnB protein